jgi:NADPH:quinone reductase-like Zn-dependent oxidoreductase
MPLTPGFEVACTVVALGEGVEAPPECTRVAVVLESGGSTPNTRSLTLV